MAEKTPEEKHMDDILDCTNNVIEFFEVYELNYLEILGIIKVVENHFIELMYSNKDGEDKDEDENQDDENEE